MRLDWTDNQQQYPVIYADPPWEYKAWSGPHLPSRAATAHYSTMGVEAICNLPVNEFAADDCVLFMWVTWPTIQDAFKVAEAWGFTYKTCAFNWVKFNPGNGQIFNGLGHWTRANTEPCLLFSKGQPKRRENGKDVSQVILGALGKHSAKPIETYCLIERLVEGPYLELFARRHKPGWDVIGNEAPDLPEVWQKPLQLSFNEED